MGKKYQRQNGESLPAFQARCQQAEAAEKAARSPPPKRKSIKRVVLGDRNADKIDGFDRDDLGESPD